MTLMQSSCLPGEYLIQMTGKSRYIKLKKNVRKVMQNQRIQQSLTEANTPMTILPEFK